MRIVHTESSKGWGGQELRVLSEAAGMVQRGHEVVIVAPADARIVAAARERNLAVDALPIGRKSLAGLRAMHRWLRANPADIVNTHSSTDSWLVALATRWIQPRPVIVRTRHISAGIPSNLATRWLYTRATQAIVTTGEALREQLVQVNRFPAERITSVPTGMDTRRFAPGDRAAARARLGLPPEALIVGIVATLRSWKGHRFLIDAIAAIVRANAQRRPEVQLVIVGDGPQRAALESRIKERGIEARVRLAGDQADVVPWLQSFDLFALPSYANEGVPQALVQASLCGLPSVTTAVGAISEIAVAGETAVIVKPQDVDDLARGLLRLIDDPAMRERLGAAARAHAIARFAHDTMLDRMQIVFTNALQGARRG